ASCATSTWRDRGAAVTAPSRSSLTLWREHGVACCHAQQPPGPLVIVAESLTKRHGATTAVDGVDFAVRPGAVTRILGPDSAGKSAAMRMIGGLDHPSGGRVTVAGTPYARLRRPLHRVGALLRSRPGRLGGGAARVRRAAAAPSGR